MVATRKVSEVGRRDQKALETSGEPSVRQTMDALARSISHRTQQDMSLIMRCPQMVMLAIVHGEAGVDVQPLQADLCRTPQHPVTEPGQQAQRHHDEAMRAA